MTKDLVASNECEIALAGRAKSLKEFLYVLPV